MFSKSEIAEIKKDRPPSASELRMNLEISQTQMATEVGVKQPTVNGWERGGDDAAMSLDEDQLYKYYQALKADPDTFVNALPPSVTLSNLSRESLLRLVLAFVEGREKVETYEP